MIAWWRGIELNDRARGRWAPVHAPPKSSIAEFGQPVFDSSEGVAAFAESMVSNATVEIAA